MEGLGANAFFDCGTSGFVKKTNYDSNMRLKATYLVLATAAALNDVKNKISKVSDLVKKKKKWCKNKDIEDISFATSDYVVDHNNFLIFQPILNTFTMTSSLKKRTVAWQSTGLSIEQIRPPNTSNNSLSPKLK